MCYKTSHNPFAESAKTRKQLCASRYLKLSKTSCLHDYKLNRPTLILFFNSYFFIIISSPNIHPLCVHICMQMFGQIPKQTVHELWGEKELNYFFLMPFVWRKRCWLTAELQDPTQPGFSADAWLMRSTTGIIIRQGILVFSCVSQDGKTSSSAVPKQDFYLPSTSYLPCRSQTCDRY